jgi:hypothetical protein
MVGSRVPLCSSNGAVDELLDAGPLRRIGEIVSLRHFTFRSNGPEILDAVDAVNTTDGGLERRDILQVSTHEFNTLIGQKPSLP